MFLESRFIVAGKQINTKNTWYLKDKKEKHKINKTIKNFWKPKHSWYKINYYRTPHKLSKAIKYAEKLGSKSSLYSDTKKVNIF